MRKLSGRERKARIIIMQSMMILIAFMVTTVILYNGKFTPNYTSLEEAVKETTKGGKIELSYEYETGTFVFIKKGNKDLYNYYYKKDNKWYKGSSIKTKKYNINDDYYVQTYYIKKQNYYFIKVNSGAKEIESLSDSMETEFKKMNLSDKNEIYFGDTQKDLTRDYTITINKEEFYLRDYDERKGLYQ